MNDYLSKPIDPEALARVIVRWLPEAPARRESGDLPGPA
jgi:hypothetical protein